ncbi:MULTISPECIES: SdrD B-like domain-containing protein [Amycolatopsis]|uniref:SdrD B-like domain-containing protein n=1 Tax=Amycolatopsis TaxID=1813 RepID=UPI001E4B4523|nr:MULTISPECIES: SdrD B-like domain-containing protein [Amycolatopsis]
MARHVLAALVCAAAVLGLSTPLLVATADDTDGPLTVRVVRGETGVGGILVVATDPSGASVSGVTGPDGSVQLATTPLSGGKYRVDAAIPASMPDVKPAVEDQSRASLTEFVDVGGGKAVTLTMGVGGMDGPVQLGDRTWFDTDGDGIQDGDEPPLPGVRVQLLGCDGGGAPLAEKTTDRAGRYLFGPAEGLQPHSCYTLKFDFSGVDTGPLPGSPPVEGLKWTVPHAGDQSLDSDVDPADGSVRVAIGPPGAVDHTVDAGVVGGLNRVGDLVWADSNRNGLQDPGEPGIADVGVRLQKADGSPVAGTSTGPHGQYQFSHLPDGSYQVCFDTAKLPPQYGDYQLTRQRAGSPGQDSAPDPATGCTAPTELKPDRTQDLTMDAGLAPPVNRIAALVWQDVDGDGRPGAIEPGIAGVPVKLRAADGTQFAMTTTGPDGKYAFDDLPSGAFAVCFDLANLPPSAADFTPVEKSAASGADPATGCTSAVTLGLGKREDTALNAGLAAPVNRIGERVWADTNRNGIADDTESGPSGVPVKLLRADGGEEATTTTGADGQFRFTGIPDGTYQVCVDRGALPAPVAGYQFTRPRAGESTKDSDVDLVSGCAPPVVVGVGHRDGSVGVGLAPARNRLGDLLWLDRNGNGEPDAGEPGAAGVAVTMKDAEGRPVAVTRTAADGSYLLDDLPDGSFRVCFDLTDLPDLRLVGSDEPGCSGPVDVGPKPREDLSARFGLVSGTPAVVPAAQESVSGGGFPVGWVLFGVVAAIGLVVGVRWWKAAGQEP